VIGGTIAPPFNLAAVKTSDAVPVVSSKITPPVGILNVLTPPSFLNTIAVPPNASGSNTAPAAAVVCGDPTMGVADGAVLLFPST